VPDRGLFAGILLIAAALFAIVVYGLRHEMLLARTKVLILGELMLRSRVPALTTLDLYRRLNRRIGLGLIHLAVGDLEAEGFVYVSLDDTGKTDRDGLPDRVVSLSFKARPHHDGGVA
jgi:hypothetical protein